MNDENSTAHHQASLSARQLASLRGVIDALLPPLSPPSEGDEQDNSSTTKSEETDKKENSTEEVCDYYQHVLSSDRHFIDIMQDTILTKLPSTECFLLGWVLYLLSTAVGTALLFGTLSPLWTLRSFSDWTRQEQTAAMIYGLQQSRLTPKRRLFNSLKRLICGLAFSFVPPTNDQQEKSGNDKTSEDDQDEKSDTPSEERIGNPFWPAMGYPGPYHWNIPPEEDAKRLKQVQDFLSMDDVMVNVTGNMELMYDVVIVGSGAGGGVAAATFASKGYTVIVLEKGPYVSPSQVSNLEAESFDKMYETHGLLTTSDGNVVMLAGSTLGGGTTINWSCCLDLPDHVRDEWVNKHGLRQFAKDQEFDAAMEVVTSRIGCHKPTTHNNMNQKLQQGCDVMQWKWEATAQNLRNIQDDSSGYICFGDRYGNKQSGLVTFLADAVKCGAKIIENCTVERVIQGLYVAPTGRRRRRALGVVGYVGDHRITVKARKCVISAAGSLNTPGLLRRSWLRNPHIGRHLRIHPVSVTYGFFDKKEPIDFFRGAPMTTVCSEFEHGPNNNGYGAKIECPSAHTGLGAACFQYIDPENFKRDKILRANQLVTLITLQRDSGEGRVQLGGDDFSPKVDYTVNAADKKSMMNTFKACIKILIASGAQEVSTIHMNDRGLLLSDDSPKTREDIESDPGIKEYLSQIDSRGMKDHEIGVFSAHQMGSCRMSITPESGVVDDNGECWECDDLFVFDASTFPTASAANPMMTVLAISRMLSSRLVLRLLNEDGRMQDTAELSRAMHILRLARLRVSQSNQYRVTDFLRLGLGCLVPLVIVWWFWSPEIVLTERLVSQGEL